MSKRSLAPGATDDDAEPGKFDQKLKTLDLLKRIESDTMSSTHKKPRRYVSLLQISASKPASVLSAFAASVLDKVAPPASPWPPSAVHLCPARCCLRIGR